MDQLPIKARPLPYQRIFSIIAALLLTAFSCNECDDAKEARMRFFHESRKYQHTTGGNARVFEAHMVFQPETSITLQKTASGQLTATNLAPLAGSSWQEELEQNGFVGIRVPHVAPDYVASAIQTFKAEYKWYESASDTTASTIQFDLVRRPEYESRLQGRFPITDGRSHWEAWWLAEGTEVPTPDGDFEIRPGYMPLHLYYQIQVSGSGQAIDCAGCEISYVGFSGYSFWGPFTDVVVFADETDPAGATPFSFDPECGDGTDYAETFFSEMEPGQPVEHVIWLANYETTARTYSLTPDSSQGWNYTYQTVLPGEQPANLSGPPYTVTIGAAPTSYPHMSCIGILASAAPDLSGAQDLREMFTLTASGGFTTHTAKAQSLATGSDYIPANELSHKVYLPRLSER